MPAPVTLRFESRLAASAEEVWQWITSLEGIAAEMRPLLRMTAPAGLRSLTDVPLTLGVPLFRSYLLLFRVLPVDYSDLTLTQLEPGRGFVEQSHMGSMKQWRHVRQIRPGPDSASVMLVDELTFVPRVASTLTRWGGQAFFRHRHRVLRRHFPVA